MGNCNGIFTTCQNEDGSHVGTVDKENMKKAYLANKAGGQELDDSYDQSFAKSGTVDFKQVSGLFRLFKIIRTTNLQGRRRLLAIKLFKFF